MSYANKSTFATLPRTTRGVPIVLGGDPKGQNFLYTNNNSVIIRDIANPAICDIYTEHSTQVLVAKFSPSGYYIASGDAHGKVRIWDTTQKEHILKDEYQPLSGAIKDIAWSGDSQRIVAVGEGREKFGHVFNASTGTSVGEICGHSKPINSVDFRADRPYRIVTAGEDNVLSFFQGPPFKFDKTLKDHTRFVNAVRYAPDGSVIASGGADGRSFIYDGKSGELMGQFGEPAHSGGIYAVSFSPDSKQFMSVSADKTAKVWDVETTRLVTEFHLGTTMLDMQVGCLWQNDYLLSVSLSGHINYLDKNNPDTPLRIIKGHNKPLTALALNEERDTAFTAASDGKVCYWDMSTGEAGVIKGNGHSNQISDMRICEDVLVTCGMDDTIIYTDANTKTYGESVKMPSQPRGLAVGKDGLVVVACVNEVVVVRNRSIVYCHKADYEPGAAAIHQGQTEVAIGGGNRDQKVHIFSLDNDTLKELRTLDHAGLITDMAYSPDGSTLAVTDANRRLILYSVANDHKLSENTDWCSHTARVNSVSWTPDSLHLGTGSLDCSLIAWTPTKPLNQLIMRGAHPQYQVTRVQWIDENNIVSIAQDSCVKVWTISEFA